MIAHGQDLHDLFSQTLDGLGEMSRLLEEEARSLAARDTEALELTASKKQKLAFLLNDLAARQNHLVRACGFQGNEGGVAAFLDRLDPESPQTRALLAEWREIVRLGSACRKQNELNGAYIALLQRHIDSSLNFLHGASSADATYGPDGSTRRGETSRQSFSA